MQGHLRVAAAPLSLGAGENTPPGQAVPKAPSVPANEIQVRSLLETGPVAAAQKDSGDLDLFQDVDPKALATILLQALQPEAKKPSGQQLSPKPSANEERVRSETSSSEVQPEREQEDWKAGNGASSPHEAQEGESQPEEQTFDLREMETLQALLQDLQHYRPTAKREEPSRDSQAGPPESPPGGDVLQELEEYEHLKAHSKRKAPASTSTEPWAGARKLKQQQHLEHQLLQRRYEELAESRRQAEEARRAAAEEERLADMASDLLLQYLLKDGGDGEEGRQGASTQEESEEEGAKGSPLLFEDEESNVAEDKRSNEVPEEEEEEGEEDNDIDPSTIDRLIELSSKLHLPADDVIDIINDVEKKKKEDLPEPSSKSQPLAAPPRHKPKKAPPRAALPQGPRLIPKPYYPPAYQPYHHLPKQDEASWNEVLKGNEYPAPKWFRAKPSVSSSSSSSNRSSKGKVSNYINPWTFHPPVYHHYRHLPGPMVPRDDYYDASQDRDEVLESYIESVLMKHPKAFQ
ncbi:neurosecretory protein VGF [Elgaria multicarinata webbii]|uniref:neurosecretory protein VGF n=1 Tax=Elgaria multicarinata webbii TaxID=159646 RepID=UPI002FCD4C91